MTPVSPGTVPGLRTERSMAAPPAAAFARPGRSALRDGARSATLSRRVHAAAARRLRRGARRVLGTHRRRRRPDCLSGQPCRPGLSGRRTTGAARCPLAHGVPVGRARGAAASERSGRRRLGRQCDAVHAAAGAGPGRWSDSRRPGSRARYRLCARRSDHDRAVLDGHGPVRFGLPAQSSSAGR